MISSHRGYMKQDCWYLRTDYYGVQHKELVLNLTNCLEQIQTRNIGLPDMMSMSWVAPLVQLHAQARTQRYPSRFNDRRGQFQRTARYHCNCRCFSLVVPYLTCLFPVLTPLNTPQVADRESTMLLYDHSISSTFEVMAE